MLTAEKDKRNKHSTKYNRGVNIIGVIDNCLGVTVIGLGITRVGILSTIVAAPAVIGMEAGMKEGLTVKCKMLIEKTGNIETEANELLRGNKICVLT